MEGGVVAMRYGGFRRGLNSQTLMTRKLAWDTGTKGHVIKHTEYKKLHVIMKGNKRSGGRK